MKKIALLLATEKGYATLCRLIKEGYKNNIGCVISFHESGVKVDWSESIKKKCEKDEIPFFFWKEVKLDLRNIILNYSITGIIAISWKYLLPLDLNALLEDPIIVFHDSLLPKYRGFAPVATAMICGDKIIGATALFASESVDQGDIIEQKSFELSDEMYIQDVIKKMADLYGEMMVEIICKMISGSITAVKQNESAATYSIWRGTEDYEIDWNKSAYEINNFIRALGYPFEGAFSELEGVKIRILEAEVEKDDLHFAIRDCGKIWSLNQGKPTVICGKGMLKIIKAIDCNGDTYEFRKIRSRLGRNNQTT